MNRHIKQIRKQLNIIKGGFRFSSIEGRFFGPKVLINSIPKSGTNLLQEIVLLLPLMRGKISRTLNADSGHQVVIKKLSSLNKGQFITGHITYDASLDNFIKEKLISHLMITRDFRDVIYSNIQYLTSNHINHPHSRYFLRLASLDEKIDACLRGNAEIGMRPWKDLIRDYRDWMNSNSILIVRYENLISSNIRIAHDEIEKIIDYLGVGSGIDISKIRIDMLNTKGLTYNQPGINKWKNNFNQSQIKLLNQEFGEDLSFFGYDV